MAQSLLVFSGPFTNQPFWELPAIYFDLVPFPIFPKQTTSFYDPRNERTDEDPGLCPMPRWTPRLPQGHVGPPRNGGWPY